MTENAILYMDLAEFDEGATLRGGALVTDCTTEPLEFRCTSAVRPTRLQRILWGARLQGHIAGNLLGLPLTKSIKQKYTLVVIQNRHFLDMRESLDLPVVLLSRGSAIEYEEKSTDDQTDGEHRSDVLTTPVGQFEPIVMKAHPQFQQDLAVAREILAPVFRQRDVMEPFERLNIALGVVHKEESKTEDE